MSPLIKLACISQPPVARTLLHSDISGREKLYLRACSERRPCAATILKSLAIRRIALWLRQSQLHERADVSRRPAAGGGAIHSHAGRCASHTTSSSAAQPWDCAVLHADTDPTTAS
jgi:hypothetical protein